MSKVFQAGIVQKVQKIFEDPATMKVVAANRSFTGLKNCKNRDDAVRLVQKDERTARLLVNAYG